MLKSSWRTNWAATTSPRAKPRNARPWTGRCSPSREVRRHWLCGSPCSLPTTRLGAEVITATGTVHLSELHPDRRLPADPTGHGNPEVVGRERRGPGPISLVTGRRFVAGGSLWERKGRWLAMPTYRIVYGDDEEVAPAPVQRRGRRDRTRRRLVGGLPEWGRHLADPGGPRPVDGGDEQPVAGPGHDDVVLPVKR